MKRRQGGRKKCHFFLSLKVIISILGPFHYCPVSLLTVLCMACKSIVFINISPCTKFFLVAMTYHLSNGKENYNNCLIKKIWVFFYKALIWWNAKICIFRAFLSVRSPKKISGKFFSDFFHISSKNTVFKA